MLQTVNERLFQHDGSMHEMAWCTHIKVWEHWTHWVPMGSGWAEGTSE